MQIKQKIIEFIVLAAGGLAFFVVFLLYFTKILDRRPPVIQEFLPIIPLVLVTLFLISNGRD